MGPGPATSDLWHLTSAPSSNYRSAKHDLPAWQERGQTDRGSSSGGAYDSLALSRPHAPSSPPVGGTLQTSTLGGQHSPSAGLPGLIPHSELRVGVTRFQSQFLGATFPWTWLGFRPHPQG